MRLSALVQIIMFDYERMSDEEIIVACKQLPRKILRWLGAHHPDNKIRKIFFTLTNVAIGEGSVINAHFIVSDDYQPLLTIGKRVAISPNVTVICQSGPNNSRLNDNVYVAKNLVCNKKVIIENDAWIGANVVILPGVRIGARSIIGAGSVVADDVDKNCIFAGVPARKIRRIT